VRLPGLAEYGAPTIASDHEGGVWLAGGSALVLVREGQFVSYSPRNGLSYGFVTTVVEDAGGSIWIATGKGLNRLRDGALSVFGSQQGLPEAVIGALAEDRAGFLWVGTDKGVYRSQAPVRAGEVPAPPRFMRVEGQPSPPLVSRLMHAGSDGAIWVGTAQQGLARFQDGAVTTWSTRQGLLHDAVRGLEDDGAGGLWIATHGGLQHLEGGVLTSYTEREGLPQTMLEGLGRDRTGALWIGSKRGVLRFKDGRFTLYRERDGLFSGFVNAFVDDGRGNLWMGSGQGVFRVPLAELEAFAAGRATAVSSVVYGLENGMVTEVVTGGAEFCRPMYQSRDGRIWAALTRGVSVVDPAHLQARRPPPPVAIESVSANEQVLGLAPSLRVPPGRGDLAIRYAALGFVGAHKTRFKYRLDGYDRDWQDGEDRRIAQYSNLRPGRYTFRVIAANSDGVWNQQGATVTLELMPRWHQTPVFRVALVLALVLSALGLHRWRLRGLERKERELERKVAERTATPEAIVKELESFSYSASHDLRAPLRSIEGFSKILGQHLGEGLDQTARELLARMQTDSARMRGLVEDLLALARVGKSDLRRSCIDLAVMAREIVAELRERERERVVELVVAGELKVEGDPNLLRIALENLLGNAWKVTGKRPAARIELGSVGRDGEGGAVFFVRDDGAGFDDRHAAKLFQPFQRLHGP
jgi:signal transduction histidine kinase